MRKYLGIIVFLIVFMTIHGNAQDIKQATVAPKTDKTKKTAKASGEKSTSGKKPPAIIKGTVLVITDEPCKIFIGDLDQGIFKKGETRNLSVPQGSYELIATHPVTGDQFKTDITVGSTKTIVRINLNAVRAEAENAARIKEANEKRIRDSLQAALIKGENTPDTTMGTSVKAVIGALLSNMIHINGGTFIMGNNVGYNDESPEHTVNITAFQFSKYEVTQQQWKAIMGNNPSKNPDCENCPVNNVSWIEVDSFLTRINRSGTKHFRLPTEAEWEYMAKAGADTQDIRSKAWYGLNSEKQSHPVGKMLPNSLGIYDMQGNVAEWCSDWYDFNYYQTRSGADPPGPKSGKLKVVRGGSYNSREGELRVSIRDKEKPGNKSSTIGFRLVTM